MNTKRKELQNRLFQWHENLPDDHLLKIANANPGKNQLPAELLVDLNRFYIVYNGLKEENPIEDFLTLLEDTMESLEKRYPKKNTNIIHTHIKSPA